MTKKTTTDDIKLIDDVRLKDNPMIVDYYKTKK